MDSANATTHDGEQTEARTEVLEGMKADIARVEYTLTMFRATLHRNTLLQTRVASMIERHIAVFMATRALIATYGNMSEYSDRQLQALTAVDELSDRWDATRQIERDVLSDIENVESVLREMLEHVHRYESSLAEAARLAALEESLRARNNAPVNQE